MPRHTSSNFTPELTDLAAFAKALGHPARIAIIQALLRQPEGRCCGHFVEALPLSQASVSQHLKALVEVHLLEIEARGPSNCYRLRMDRLRSFCHAFQETLGTNPAPTCSTAGPVPANTHYKA